VINVTVVYDLLAAAGAAVGVPAAAAGTDISPVVRAPVVSATVMSSAPDRPAGRVIRLFFLDPDNVVPVCVGRWGFTPTRFN
jgi:hypothetical protein